MRDPEKDNILLRKGREINSLKLQLQEAKELATIKEKVLKAELKEKEKLYKELTKKLEDIQAKGFEIRVLKALNEIIATASRYLSLSDILAPTLKAVIESLETLEETEGRKVKITGGVFLLNEETCELFLASSYGISLKALGCQGNVALGDCICGLAAQSGQVNAAPYCLADPGHTRKPSFPPKEDHAHINIPLKSGDKVFGVIFLHFSPPGYQP
ncbi:MAG TPA: hypothetical protein DD713_08190 [Nitrospiraceae bacterium]|nr:hypothetical protein [Nitrospiraceae bacterium]